MHIFTKKIYRGFTLTELLVVVSIIALVVGFTLPNFSKSLRRAREKDMKIQLGMINTANSIYYARNGAYWFATVNPTTSVDTINEGLGIDLIADDVVFYYERTDADNYTAQAATPDFDSSDFILQVDEGEIDDDNPACISGANCP